MTWRPISERLRTERAKSVLYEGIEQWMWPSIFVWFEQRLVNSIGEPDSTTLMAMERDMRMPLDWSDGTYSALRSLRGLMLSDPEVALDVLSYLLYISSNEYRRSDIASELEGALASSGSAWRVVDEENDALRLERRVSDSAVRRHGSVSKVGRSGEHLRAAWVAMYGRVPNPDEAYDEAVKAIEAAGARAVIPKDPRPSLGKMIAAFRDDPTKWSVRLGSSADQGHATVLLMMQAVWGPFSMKAGAV